MPYIISRNNCICFYNDNTNNNRYEMNDLKSVYSHYNPKTG